MCCKCCSQVQRKLWVFGTGTFLLILGLIIGLIWPPLSEKILNQQLELRNGSMNYHNWIETPIPMYFDLYLFNWTNPHELAEPGFKPKFTEYGPLVFTEKHTRVDVDWNKNNTVSYYQVREWHFMPELSNGTLKEPITHANVITATVAHLMRNQSKLVKKAINYLLNHKGGDLTWTKPAGEWLFDGFDDKLLTFLKKFNSPAIDIPFEKFGWLVDRNMSKTYDGRYGMFTGTDEINKLGYLTEWNYSNKTKFYEGTCAMVNGTSGELWPPSIDTNSFVSVFASDICRSIDIYPQDSYTLHGVTGTIWKATNRTLDNGQIDPNNVCFCPDGDPNKCPKSGVIDVSKCRWNAPVSFSFPHFYLADPSYVEAVEGIKPEKEKHEFYMALEPTAGIPISVSAKFQINMKLQRDEEIDIYKHVQEDVEMPMFWFAQRAELDEDTASKAKLALALPIIGVAVGYSVAGVGAIIIIVGITLSILKKWGGSYHDDRQPLNDEFGNQNFYILHKYLIKFTIKNMSRKHCSGAQKKLWTFFTGLLVLVIGLCLGILWPTLSKTIFHKQLQLRNGSAAYYQWINRSVPTYFDVYLFNWTNPHKLQEPNFKPHFVEYGPLVFSEKRIIVDINWNPNHTVSFHEIKQWNFEPILSNGTLDEPITHANVITAIVANIMKSQNDIVKELVNYMLNNTGSLTWTKPAGQWIFEGFDDKLLSFLKQFNSFLIDIPLEKFGWLVDRNMSKTYEGHFEINTGTDEIHKLGYITYWNYSRKTDFYDEHCSMINGTEGDLWPPLIDTNKFLSIFIRDICRSVNIYPDVDILLYGVSGTIWKATQLTLDSGQIEKNNLCFCPNSNIKECHKYGVVDASKCFWGAPISISFPHFYLADSSYIEAIEGIKPDKKKHEFYIALEKSAGIPIVRNMKFQINMKLQHVQGIDIYKDIKKDVLMPMYWFNRRSELDKETASKIKLNLAPPIIIISIGYSLAAVGFVILIAGIALIVVKQ
ncbi:uncharacterized protein LOC129608368 [Condylostylus longicornis]|uniref:uncharacterized protein LOC129608368 n=1 Tax=Condylostylus longicornis TaxID=2530218 RepID=UPI00244DB6C4|nr:uncharacterized protein LOC129608368 [Condylostylus longicornis]